MAFEEKHFPLKKLLKALKVSFGNLSLSSMYKKFLCIRSVSYLLVGSFVGCLASQEWCLHSEGIGVEMVLWAVEKRTSLLISGCAVYRDHFP